MQIPRAPPGEGKTIVFFDFLEDGAENKVLRHAKTLVFFDFLVRRGWKTLVFLMFS